MKVCRRCATCEPGACCQI